MKINISHSCPFLCGIRRLCLTKGWSCGTFLPLVWVIVEQTTEMEMTWNAAMPMWIKNSLLKWSWWNASSSTYAIQHDVHSYINMWLEYLTLHAFILYVQLKVVLCFRVGQICSIFDNNTFEHEWYQLEGYKFWTCDVIYDTRRMWDIYTNMKYLECYKFSGMYIIPGLYINCIM